MSAISNPKVLNYINKDELPIDASVNKLGDANLTGDAEWKDDHGGGEVARFHAAHEHKPEHGEEI